MRTTNAAETTEWSLMSHLTMSSGVASAAEAKKRSLLENVDVDDQGRHHHIILHPSTKTLNEVPIRIEIVIVSTQGVDGRGAGAENDDPVGMGVTS